jgi:hypothetical protein
MARFRGLRSFGGRGKTTHPRFCDAGAIQRSHRVTSACATCGRSARPTTATDRRRTADHCPAGRMSRRCSAPRSRPRAARSPTGLESGSAPRSSGDIPVRGAHRSPPDRVRVMARSVAPPDWVARKSGWAPLQLQRLPRGGRHNRLIAAASIPSASSPRCP